jgi:hypothetical protein
MTSTQLALQVDVRDPVVGRLCRDFPTLSRDAVERCVCELRLRARHLGVDLTPTLVEVVAREHLMSMIKSEPPSGRRPERPRASRVSGRTLDH